jgi:hypothetical protein
VRKRDAGGDGLSEQAARAIIYGDSLVTQAEPYLQIVARALGPQVEVRALGGAAPCDSLPPLADDLAANESIWSCGRAAGTASSDGAAPTRPEPCGRAINLLQAARRELDYQAHVAAGNAPPP